jgi:AcrR family transcriptional regulator
MVGEHVQSRSEKRRQTEEKIIAAAADLFLEHGYKATTVRGIAKTAEVSVGRVMSAGDKDALLVRCFDRWIGQLQDGTYTAPPPRRRGVSASGTSTSDTMANDSTSGTAVGRSTSGTAAGDGRPRAASAVQRHLLDIFLPLLEFFAAHEDLSRDYAAAMMRVRSNPEVFNALAIDLQSRLSSSLTSIGINEDYAKMSAAALYDSYLGILFRWAATAMSLDEATDALLTVIVFHTRVRNPL